MELDNTTLAYRKYKKPIRTYCRLYHKQVRMDVADLESEMHMVLHACVLKYDPDRGATFNTFLWQGIYNRFRKMLRDQSRQKRNFVEVPGSFFDRDDDESDESGFADSMDYLLSKNGSCEASTEETFFAILTASGLMSDPKMQKRIVSSRQYAHVPA